MPKVSIVVPVYNGAQYLADCLASIERQTLNDIEILCIDDASSDESPALLKEFAAHDGRFVCEYFLENQGAAAVRNYAIQHAKGEYLAFMDCDDWYPEDTTLEKLYDAAILHNVSVVGGSFSEYNVETGEIVTSFENDSFLHGCFTFVEESMVDYRKWQGDYGYQRFLFKTQLVRECNAVFPPYIRHEDPVFFVKVMLAAEQFWAIPEVVYRYRVRHKNPVFTEQAIRDATEALLEIIEIAAIEDLPRLRAHQYSLLRWYMFEVPVKREYGSWTEIGTIIKQQAKDSFDMRLQRVLSSK